MYFVVDFYTTTILTIIMIVYQIVYVSFFWKKKKTLTSTGSQTSMPSLNITTTFMFPLPGANLIRLIAPRWVLKTLKIKPSNFYSTRLVFIYSNGHVYFLSSIFRFMQNRNVFEFTVCHSFLSLDESMNNDSDQLV